MKRLIFLMLLLPGSAFADCVLKNELRGQRHFVCQAPGTSKKVHVLDLNGGYADTAYFHGYFLRKEIESGVLRGVQVRSERAFSALDSKSREQLQLIKKCVINNYKASVSNDFKVGLKNLYRGLKDAGSSVDWKAYEESNYMVEFSIFADSMQRQMEEDPRKASRQVFASCAPYFIGNSLLKPFKLLARGLRSIKMGCTGISASASSSRDGALLHGRNFDTGLLGFFEPDQVVVINRQSNGTTAVGIASAGLHYAGGISGFNNHGLSVSLHELQTEGTKISYPTEQSDVAPFLLHSVLLKARSLNEAIAYIQNRKGFGAWTFFISDAKTDETASIELSGDTVVVARRTKNKFLGQSNHFLGLQTSQKGYEYSLNKTLETRARLAHVEKALQFDFGNIDTQWVINRLSGHTDELVGPRAFGRTTTKLYTAATHVMLPARQEWWMSVAETYPTNRSHFVGFRLLGPNQTSPVEILGTTKAWEDPNKSAWYDSMKYYVQSYLVNEQDHDTVAGLDRTLALLETASRTAAQSEVFEFPYEFMWARIKILRAAKNIQSGQRDIAFKDLNDAQMRMTTIAARLGPQLHAYENFQLDMWQFRAETLKPQALRSDVARNNFRVRAKEILQSLILKYPRQKELYDLQKSLQQEAQLPVVLDAEIRLGTVE
ncbi:C45 family autoproteolytic acyltransferase/hydrolase [Bdellovibrio sp. HCB290]|uniref:C45 family autoproteolytic acyltransferase/hydolase n=1 Tax=Bdellovibrio sp. HCB290 TaxID=3394356 RepID=UPI0039B5606A